MANKNQNSVYLYRNGIADFRQSYMVSATGEKVSIPVKQDQVGDVLASIDYFGKIRLTKPPGYSPKTNNSKLTIDASDPLGSALKAFSGARITFVLKGTSGDVQGVLAGCETVEETSASGVLVPKKYVAILTDTGLQQFSLRDEIKAVKWDTDSDKAEFDKALARNYQKIKPESTFIDLTLTSTTGQNEAAILQYALPVASWNMSYRLKRDDKGRWTLDGHAIVHNSTDFDWNQMEISVVTGEPITFQHDLAEAKTPLRATVNVTAESAYGAVEVESLGGDRGVAKRASVRALSAAAPQMASYSGHAMSLEAVGAFANDAELKSAYSQAEMDMAEASTVGDFLILTSPNAADIPAGQSALVPMFSRSLDEAERVFYYKPGRSENFPYSAVKFKNTTGMPLTKGVVTVTIEGHNSGESVLESAKPNDVRLLPHTVESGIKITRDPAKMEHPITRININEGNLFQERRSIAIQEYTIKNKLEEDASVLIEHNWNVSQSDVSVSFDGEPVSGLEKISTGVRFTVKVKAGTTSHLLVRENKFDQSNVVFGGSQFNWFAQQGYFAQNEQFKNITTIQEEAARLQREKNELTNQRASLQADQQRYNGFLPNAGANKERWEKAIAIAEDQIQEINRRVPAKDQEIQKANDKLTQALRDLRVSWEPKAAKAVA